MSVQLASHVFCFNKEANGGESVTLVTRFMDNGDGVPEGVYTEQDICLQSYGNSATFNLCGAEITPAKLRQLADQLVEARHRAEWPLLCAQQTKKLANEESRLKAANDYVDRLYRGEIPDTPRGTQEGDHISIPLTPRQP